MNEKWETWGKRSIQAKEKTKNGRPTKNGQPKKRRSQTLTGHERGFPKSYGHET